ncbi:hypothetical protein CR513_27247, partial [Mucuna pruriens]
MVIMFIDTLQPPFFKKMEGNVSSNFVDLVIIRERVEMGPTITYTPIPACLPNTTSIPISTLAKLPTTSTLDHTLPNTRTTQPNANPSQRRNTPRVLSPIPMSYVELLAHLIQNSLIATVPLKPIQTPYLEL